MKTTCFRLALALGLASGVSTVLAQGPSLLPVPAYVPAAPVSAGYYPYNAYSGAMPTASPVMAAPNYSAAGYNPAAGVPALPLAYQDPMATGQDTPTAMPAQTGCASGACNTGCCPTDCRSPWYGGAAGLVLFRAQSDPFHFNFESTTPGVCIMRSDDPALFGDNWGGQVTLGRRVGCCGNGAVEGTFWAVDSGESCIDTILPGQFLNTTIGLDNPSGGPNLMLGGNTLDFWFDGAQAQRLHRDSDIYNAEANGLYWVTAPGGQNRLALGLLGGFRYFHFDETLRYGSLRPGGTFGGNGGLDEAWMNFGAQNDLFGGQVGARALWAATERLGVFLSPKVGILGNVVEQHTLIYRGDGLTALDLKSTDGQVAVLGELDAGLNYALTPWCSVFGGYRVLGISGIGLADDQIEGNVHFTDEILDVNTNGGLFLHGAFFGMMFNY
ncbi:MAG: hypothetical protein K1X74_00910 [Pirellulales bacterium]|nr:hypothetical protein [Pirellulales bacterium]